MKSICVFCGSGHGKDPSYATFARELGSSLARKGITLVYGGGKVGLMGEIADEVLSNNGEVIGVIPEFLYHKEVAHKSLTKLLVVESMHERKQKMSMLADAFIAMPGGFGTLEELAEIITWKQLELVNKPVGILNIDAYFDHLLKFFDHCVEEQFVKKEFRERLVVATNPAELLLKIMDYRVERQTSDELGKT